MAIDFDDGHSEIPGGIDGPVERVLVIGAGIAGLTVANALMHAGVECVVLEARSRIGGRLHTVDLDGAPVDLGGSWVHEPVGNPMSRFLDSVGIGTRPGNPLATLSAFDCATGLPISHEEIGLTLDVELEGFEGAIDELRERLGPTASVADGIEAYLETTGLDGDRLRRGRQGLLAMIEGDAAGAADDMSLQWLWTQESYDGDFFGDLPDGGYVTAIDAMAAGLDIRRAWPAVSIEIADEGVVVSSASGETLTGSHVVVTVPLGVLKSGALDVSPALPPERTEAIDRLGFGRYEKVAMAFAEPFWREVGWSHGVLFPTKASEPAMWVFDHDAFRGNPILECHVFHSAAHHTTGRSGADAVGWVTGMLSDAIGLPCPEPVAVAVTGWVDDPFALGAYAHVPPGASNSDLDLLGDPLAGRLLFAGEHTQSARVGYADGAMRSGVREAKRLLGTATVELGRLA
ncbi:flavin monoamine oxidase family protein [Naasia lichenicola]|uniref:FAD-dependent oxidoreductase n=1 Tax=Naasia lichenicola TaxID=2565933 RepID=A0A4S4FEN8_9MICO|nr:NAD(P)/FAD-dependent oxidoreductase [Naasia lichenicola]THG28448.1 FAD-dependent oxidoreductase [Naasia lichenicola]